MSKEKFVMILERSGENLTVSKKNEDYVLEGVFAQFGVENNNHRIYEEKEYLPHMDYLKKKIEENRLLGELDHPEKFDISLNKVSHLIEEIRYDAKKRQVVGKIKLLDTPSGQIAKNLVDSGVPISISSRAAGVVKENKTVEIKRIFTYDLVADPGFENAQMKRINESLGYSDNDDLAIYDMTDKASLAFMETLNGFATNNTLTEKTHEKMQEFVTTEDMNKYSLIIKEEIEKMNNRFEKISESGDKENKINLLKEEVKNLQQYATYLAEEQNKALGFANYLAEKMSQSISYTEHVAERTDNAINYAEHIAERADKGIQYTESVSEKVGQTIEFANYLAEKQDQGLGFANYLAEKLGNTIGYAEHIAEHADNSIRYSEYLSENAASMNDFKALTEYTEYIAEGLSSKSSSRTNDINEDDVEENETEKKGVLSGAVKESRNIIERYSALDDKIKNVLESIEKQRMESISLDKIYPFVKFLGEEKLAAFKSLSEADKMRVANANNAKPAYDEAGIVNVWETALAKTEINEKWLTNIPADFLPLWEAASVDVKERINRQSKVYRLETEYQITNFWQTRGLSATYASETEMITESVNAVAPAEKLSTLGYSESYIESIKKGLDRYKK